MDLEHSPIPEKARCPACGAKPSDESVRRANLSAVGYLHEDKNLACSDCDERWTVGIPYGSPDYDTWECEACGGDFMPHFVYVKVDEEEVHIRPKCQDCYWVKDRKIVLDLSTADTRDGLVARFFVGHHAVTGNREEAERNPI